MTRQLLQAARRARKQAYCPYSGFTVGAAVETSDGRVFTGCNVENASYGLAICAERVAVFCAVSSGARRIVRIAVSCPPNADSNPQTLVPCGACRQVLAEFMDPAGEIIVDRLRAFSLHELLPTPFRLRRRSIDGPGKRARPV
jgi:cytidine deaminase